MKRLLAALIVISVMMGLASCNSGGTSSQGSSSVQASDTSSDFPSKPITIINPSSPGDTYDLLCRLIARHAEKYLGTTVIVENVSGGSFTIGTKKALEDASGYTWVIGTNQQFGLTPYILKADYDPVNDWCTTGSVGECRWTLVASTKTLQRINCSTTEELLQYIKDHPGELKCACRSATTTMLATKLAKAGYETTLVSYSSASEAAVAVGNGEADLGIGASNVFQALAENDNLKYVLEMPGSEEYPFAVESVPRSDFEFPDIGEAQGATQNTWYQLYSSCNVPQEIQDTMNKMIEDLGKDPDFQQDLLNINIVPSYHTADEVKAIIAEEYEDTANYYDLA